MYKNVPRFNTVSQYKLNKCVTFDIFLRLFGSCWAGKRHPKPPECNSSFADLLLQVAAVALKILNERVNQVTNAHRRQAGSVTQRSRTRDRRCLGDNRLRDCYWTREMRNDKKKTGLPQQVFYKGCQFSLCCLKVYFVTLLKPIVTSLLISLQSVCKLSLCQLCQQKPGIFKTSTFQRGGC